MLVYQRVVFLFIHLFFLNRNTCRFLGLRETHLPEKRHMRIFTKDLQEILILYNIPNTQNLIQKTIPKSVSSKHQLQITFWKQNEEKDAVSFRGVKQQIHTFH